MQVQQAIVTSETNYSIRTYILLSLNLVGAAICLSINIVLTLTAMGIIFKEENRAPVVTRFIASVFEGTFFINKSLTANILSFPF
ncbi:unnamed protein product [Arctia plantaginis]|uniref:Uncharacterized protein n=1 Tax=Arctia plantaginis TaxID=874455 RepID=A0A8S0ZT17_ARCPL|nr:unnamed protein product [Arctia plantaginis]